MLTHLICSMLLRAVGDSLSQWVYLWIFTLELVVKVVAYGFVVHRDSYLRDPWCRLDFAVVSLGWLPIILPSMGNYSVIRSMRVLRPLRALKRMPGMPVLINSLLSAIPRLASVVTLCALIVLVLSIIGMHEFGGLLHYRCGRDGVAEPTHRPSILPTHRPSILPSDEAMGGDSRRRLRTAGIVFGVNEWDTGRFCDPLSPHGTCPTGSRCVYFEENLNYG